MYEAWSICSPICTISNKPVTCKLLCMHQIVKNGHTVAVVRASPKLTDYRQKMVVFHQRSSSIIGRLPSRVVFHQRLSSIKGRLISKAVFHKK